MIGDSFLADEIIIARGNRICNIFVQNQNEDNFTMIYQAEKFLDVLTGC